jgi:hypothetical protein
METPAMVRRYAIVSSADQRVFVDALEEARAENSPAFGPARFRGYFGRTPYEH